MLSSSLVNRPVLSLQAGGVIATAQEPIINPGNLKIIGWRCKSGNHKLILLTQELRDISEQGLIVNDLSALSSPEELVRHHEIINLNFQLTSKPVKSGRGRLGKVSDYSYNEGLFVQKLYVDQPLVKVLSGTGTLIIDRTQIQEITDSYILVNDTDVKASSEEMATAAAIIPST